MSVQAGKVSRTGGPARATTTRSPGRSSLITQFGAVAATLTLGTLGIGLGYWIYQRRARSRCIECRTGGAPIMVCLGCRTEYNCCSEACWGEYCLREHYKECFHDDQLPPIHPDLVEILLPPPCNACGDTEGIQQIVCRCRKRLYCDAECEKDYLPKHKSHCVPVLAQMPPKTNAPSAVVSPLLPELLAHSMSFLSQWQWAQASRVSHAWRNASLLPMAMSHGLIGAVSWQDLNPQSIGPVARRNLRSIELSQIEQVDLSTFGSLPHLRRLTYNQAFDTPPEMARRTHEFVLRSGKTLESLTMLAAVFGPYRDFDRMSRLHTLQLFGVSLPMDFVDCLPSLRTMPLRKLLLPTVMAPLRNFLIDPITAAERAEGVVKFQEVLIGIATIPTLANLRLICQDHRFAPSSLKVSWLLGPNGPLFSAVTQLELDSADGDEAQLAALGGIATHFPQLTNLYLNQHESSSTREIPAARGQRWKEALIANLSNGLKPMAEQLLALRIRVLRPFVRESLAGTMDFNPSTWIERAFGPADLQKLLSSFTKLEKFCLRTANNGFNPTIFNAESLATLAQLLPSLRVLALNSAPQDAPRLMRALQSLKKLEYLALTISDPSVGQASAVAAASSMKRDAVAATGDRSSLKILAINFTHERRDYDLINDALRMEDIIAELPRIDCLIIETPVLCMGDFVAMSYHRPFTLGQFSEDMSGPMLTECFTCTNKYLSDIWTVRSKKGVHLAAPGWRGLFDADVAHAKLTRTQERTAWIKRVGELRFSSMRVWSKNPALSPDENRYLDPTMNLGTFSCIADGEVMSGAGVVNQMEVMTWKHYVTSKWHESNANDSLSTDFLDFYNRADPADQASGLFTVHMAQL